MNVWIREEYILMNVWKRGSGCGRRRVLRGIHIDECLDKGKWMRETEGLKRNTY